ncbi:MAG: starch-binding protein, partial [Paludibacteraceae bacterium]|nr:starch-binding protein [Paludibacteraceae bacterium]
MKTFSKIVLAGLLWLTATLASADSFTVRFKRPASWNATPHIHAWYNSTIADNQTMRATSDADWFEYTLDTDDPVHLIFNNGGWGSGNNQTATLDSQLPYDMCLTSDGSGADIHYTACPEDEEVPLTVWFKRPDGWTETPHLHLYRQAHSHSNRVIYEITVLNYSAAGTFNALAADLDRIHSLGVNTLWLMPIFKLGEQGKVGAYGSPYAIRDYRAVNPVYGTLDDFKALVNAAHSRGMEVWLDIACNHTSKDHAWVSAHPDYYASSNGQRPYSPNGWNDVYQLDFHNPALRAEMIENLKYWVRECDIDGYRCDYASGIPVGFWQDAAREVARIKSIYWLAENDDASYTAAFDGDYAWAFYSRLTEFAANPNVAQLISQCQNLYNDAAYRQKNKLIHLTNHDRSAYEG